VDYKFEIWNIKTLHVDSHLWQNCTIHITIAKWWDYVAKCKSYKFKIDMSLT
jgi:hypothetical protein